MTYIKSFSVGNGDMYFIKHRSDSFTIIDCFLGEDNKKQIVEELIIESKNKGVARFISTHPDEDHICGLDYLDRHMPVINFYCVKNEATKKDPSESFKKYCELRDSDKAFYVQKGCARKWLNQASEERERAGLHFWWPVTSNAHYLKALQEAKEGTAFNNTSLIVRYSMEENGSFLWLGDLETKFMEDIERAIDFKQTDIIFAPHHGRNSGKIPNSWLDKLKPKIIVIGEAPSRHLNYYTGYKTITQNLAGEIIFDMTDNKEIDIYCSGANYNLPYLKNKWKRKFDHYKGTLILQHEQTHIAA
jgi:beta-lactamase superfamily II metal-dependent hydrolase